jgi:hypothetical protein
MKFIKASPPPVVYNSLVWPRSCISKHKQMYFLEHPKIVYGSQKMLFKLTSKMSFGFLKSLTNSKIFY